MPEATTTDQIIGVYQQLLQFETSNYTTFISVLLGIVVILLGVTWWWNKSGALKQIEKEVDKKFQIEKEKILKQMEEKMERQIKTQLDSYSKKVKEIEADVDRSLALSANVQKLPTFSIYWWSKHLEILLELNNQKGIRRAVEQILFQIKLMEQDEEREQSAGKNESLKIHYCREVLDIVNKLPDILSQEKKNIKDRIKDRIDPDEENS